MSNINISKNLFLDVNELQHLQSFLSDKTVLKNLTSYFGVIMDTETSLKAEKDGTDVVIRYGKAVNADGEIIEIGEDREYKISITQSVTPKWITIKRTYDHIEKGTVQISASGVLTGTGTEFTKVLRGQPNFPTKVRINGLDTNDYEVIEVISDTQAILAGIFTGGTTSYRYSCVGTFTPGFIPTEDNKFVYTYDSFNVTVTESANKPDVSVGYEFYLAKITWNSSNVMIIEDLRRDNIFNTAPPVAISDEKPKSSALMSLRHINRFTGSNNSIFEFVVENTLKLNTVFINTTDFEGYIVITATGYTNNAVSATSAQTANFFKNYRIYNRANNTYTRILKSDYDSTNTIYRFYIDLVTDLVITNSAADEYIISPDYDAIEYTLKLNNNTTETGSKFVYQTHIINESYRMHIPVYNTSVNTDYTTTPEIEFTYRLIDGNNLTTYNLWNSAYYIDQLGFNTTFPSSSKLTITIS